MRARPGRPPVVAFAIPLLVAIAVVAPAFAQDGSAAARAFQTGSQAYAHGEFRAAAAAFDEAYGLAPRGAAAYNGGLSWEAAGEGARAADDYARALRSADLGTVERADATGRLKALEPRVGRLSVFAPDDAAIAVDGVEVTDRATGLHVQPGRHAIRVRYATSGHVDVRSVRVGAGELLEVRLVDRAEVAAPGSQPAPSATASAPAVLPTDVTERPRPSPLPSSDANVMRTLAFVALGGAAVSAGVAIYAYETGLSARNQFEQGHDTDPGLRSQAENLRTASWVAWGFAGAFAATGVILYLTTPSQASASPAAPPPATAVVELVPSGVRLRVGF